MKISVLAFLGLLTGGALAQQQAPLTINSLARDLDRVEAIREVKDVQRTFSQFAQFGRWSEMAALFSASGTLQWGNATATGRQAIESWLRTDAGDMDGVRPGSLDTMIAENPLVSLSVDGGSAKARWNGQRFQGDGKSATRIQGGIYENEYVLTPEGWKISLLHYYPYYAGPYIGGWRNVGGLLPLVPYHFTPDSTGVPIPQPVGEPPATNATAAQLARRIARLNDEDEVRNLQHAYGYYVDRRMWMDVLDLFDANSSVVVDGIGSFSGRSGMRQVLERKMGPEELSWGVLNDRVLFSTLIKVDEGGQAAVARGIEIGMIGDVRNKSASWEFNVFRNKFVKVDGVWRLRELHITPLVVANYTLGWGDGGLLPPNEVVPEFIGLVPRSSSFLAGGTNGTAAVTNSSDLVELRRKLARSAAFDGSENLSSAYGFYLDDLRCDQMGAIHAKEGHKLTPFTGWFKGQEKITQICRNNYGNNSNPMRSSIAFHWRPQPVIVVSRDGRSASARSRLLQPSTSTTSAGSFNGAIYHDQMALENGVWKLWSITIDEFYWQSSGWVNGWSLGRNETPPSASPPPSSSSPRPSTSPSLSPSMVLETRRQHWRRQRIAPDVTLVEVGERESTFRGGTGPFLVWPDIQRMWFAYRNPVSGRIPKWYWPGCVPCQAKPEWSLLANGYQEPPTGPTHVNAVAALSTLGTVATVRVDVAGGPGEPVAGNVMLFEGDAHKGTAAINGSSAKFTLLEGLAKGNHTLTAFYLGSERLAPGQSSVEIVM